MEGKVGFIRKRAMIYLWRAQQSGSIISILLLGTLTAATLYRDYLKAWTDNYGLPESFEFGGVVITMMFIFIIVFGIGFMFDRLKFWKEQSIVAIERNPYGSYKWTPKELQLLRLWMAAIAGPNQTEEQKRIVALFDQWIKRSIADDPIVRKELEAVEKWVLSHDESIQKILDEAV